MSAIKLYKNKLGVTVWARLLRIWSENCGLGWPTLHKLLILLSCLT